MDANQWTQLSQIFHAALACEPNARANFLEMACAGDSALRSEIESLLAAYRDAPDALEEKLLALQTPVPLLASPWTQDDQLTSGQPLFQPGAGLGDRYIIQQFLAQGGMGEVYLADDLELGISIALKTIREGIASHPASLRCFRQEVLLARSISHPGVCRIFDIGRQRHQGAEVTFLTMEYLPGETLQTRIRERGPFTREDSLVVLRQLADALDAAHQAGVIHRDFKSSNVMIVPSEAGERAVITDFGLAVASSSSPSEDGSLGLGEGTDTPVWPPSRKSTVLFSPMALGTPAYMSPEQASGQRVGPSADLYALGVVLFEMATGLLPFRRSTPIEMMEARLHERPPLPSSLADVDPDWENAILRLLARDPAERFPTARDAVLAIEGRSVQQVRPPHSLPAELDSFVGREAALEAIRSRLESEVAAHLLTLVGAGGTGKTRLAQRYGHVSLPRWQGGAWFCDLSEARNVESIAFAVADCFDVPLGKDDPIVQLGHALASRGPVLLILDNFEQVAEHAEATLGRWLAMAPAARFLVTSRERLRLRAEVTLEVEPLNPSTDGARLFSLRGSVHRPGFRLTDENRGLVVEIVSVLEGLPLAVELAAARLRTLSLMQLRERLGHRLELLAGGERGRHETMRATLDWSWELLAPWEKATLAQASVFEGGFTLEAAEAVLTLSEWSAAPSILDVIQSLVDKSWLRVVASFDCPRFQMYSVLQDYVAEKLVALRLSSSDANECEARHGVFFARLGAKSEIEALHRHGGIRRRGALRLEVDNLAAACRRALGHEDPEVAARTLSALWEVLGKIGPVQVPAELGLRVATIRNINSGQMADVLLCRGCALIVTGAVEEASREVERARLLYREGGDEFGEGVVLYRLGTLLESQGRIAEAVSSFEEALVIHRKIGTRWMEGVIRGYIGNALRELGKIAESRACLEASLVIHREMGNRIDEGNVLGYLGALCHGQGEMDAARANYEAALLILREAGDRRSEATVLSNLAVLCQDQGSMGEAQRHLTKALTAYREVGDRRFQAIVLLNLGTLFQNQGRNEEASRFYREALSIHREVGDQRSEAAILGNLGIINYELGELVEAGRDFEDALAIFCSIGDRRSQGVLNANLGALRLDEGQVAIARSHFEVARNSFAEVGDRRLESVSLGYLGDLYMSEKSLVKAHECYEEATAVLREIGDRLELAKVLCGHGTCLWRAGDASAGERALAEAEAIAGSLDVTPKSELGRRIANLRLVMTNDSDRPAAESRDS